MDKEIAGLGIAIYPFVILIVISIVSITSWLFIVSFFRKTLIASIKSQDNSYKANLQDFYQAQYKKDVAENSSINSSTQLDDVVNIESTNNPYRISTKKLSSMHIDSKIYSQSQFFSSIISIRNSSSFLKLIFHSIILLMLIAFSFKLVIYAHIANSNSYTISNLSDTSTDITKKPIIHADIDEMSNTFDAGVVALVVDNYLITLCLCVCCLLLWYALSVLDFEFFYVPNILLIALFVASVGIYYWHTDSIDIYPFGMLGIFYIFFFIVHCFSIRQLLGEGDIWVIASMFVLLATFFESDQLAGAECIVVASLLGIFASCGIYVHARCRYGVHLPYVFGVKIPFVPFLFVAFVIVSLLYVA